MQKFLINQPKLTIEEASVEDLLIDDSSHVYGVVCDSKKNIFCKKIVITTGTFLRGIIHISHQRYAAGRHIRNSEEVEPPSIGLAKTLEKKGFPLGRLTTGTPPRLDGRTINFDGLEEQMGDEKITFFSFRHQYGDFIPPNKQVKNHYIIFFFEKRIYFLFSKKFKPVPF
jgi:tRNA uridine 5-carboxymethylaminomethyl modification enzyme